MYIFQNNECLLFVKIIIKYINKYEWCASLKNKLKINLVYIFWAVIFSKIIFKGNRVIYFI